MMFSAVDPWGFVGITVFMMPTRVSRLMTFKFVPSIAYIVSPTIVTSAVNLIIWPVRLRRSAV